jgi:hypothetical protein
MSSATKNLIHLCEQICDHEGITHWAVSRRIYKKGDFFHRIKNGTRPFADTIEKGIRALSESWPADLEWPEHIARPCVEHPDEVPHDDA